MVLPMKLPGHRALPGVLTLLMFSRCFKPFLLLIFSLAMPVFIIAIGISPATFLVVWILPTLVIILLQNKKLTRSIIFFLSIGLLFGGLSFLLSTYFGIHKTPEILRFAGHLLFGGLGGLGVYLICSKFKSR